MNTKRLLLTALIAAPMIVGIQSQTSMFNAQANNFKEFTITSASPNNYTPSETQTALVPLHKLITISNVAKEVAVSIYDNEFKDVSDASDDLINLYNLIAALAGANFDEITADTKEIADGSSTGKSLEAINATKHDTEKDDTAAIKFIYKQFMAKLAAKSEKFETFSKNSEKQADHKGFITMIYSLTDGALELADKQLEESQIDEALKDDELKALANKMEKEYYLTQKEYKSVFKAKDPKKYAETDKAKIKARFTNLENSTTSRSIDLSSSASQHAHNIYTSKDKKYSIAIKGLGAVKGDIKSVKTNIEAERKAKITADNNMGEKFDFTDEKTIAALEHYMALTHEDFTNNIEYIKTLQIKFTEQEAADPDLLTEKFKKIIEADEKLGYNADYDLFRTAFMQVDEEIRAKLASDVRELIKTIYTKNKEAKGKIIKTNTEIKDALKAFALALFKVTETTGEKQKQALYEELFKEDKASLGLPEKYAEFINNYKAEKPKYEVDTPQGEIKYKGKAITLPKSKSTNEAAALNKILEYHDEQVTPDERNALKAQLNSNGYTYNATAGKYIKTDTGK